MLTPALKETLQSQLQSAINMPISSWESIPIGGGSINQTWQITINKKNRTYTTASNGTYTILSIPNGTYSVTYSGAGYKNQVFSVTISGNTVIKNVTLTK